ncbi:MAG: cytochrome c biogenesis protein ResB [Agromyces sp.]
MSRPSDYVDARPELPDGGSPARNSRLDSIGWLRWVWTQLTSMRTALVLLLMLAIAAVPGSLVPQRSSDPNGVTQYFSNNPDLAPTLNWFGLFDVYSSVWFSAIYILLFVSLIGCVIPRARHHWDAMRAQPPATPMRLDRLPAFTALPTGGTTDEVLNAAEAALKRARYRVERYDRGAPSLSAERGYLRETGNLVFHVSLIGVLFAVAFGGGFGYTGQRTVVVGQSFVNTLASYDSFNPGRWFQDAQLDPFSIELNDMQASYETQNQNALGQPIDYLANVTVTQTDGSTTQHDVKVNDPLRTNGADVYLLGNGYAPTITVRDPQGTVVFRDSVPFLPQDKQLTSVGVVKVPDGLSEQIGMVGFFYPTQAEGSNGAYYSAFPDLLYPMVTLNVFSGDLGLDDGTPSSVYQLDTSKMTQLNGRKVGTESIELQPGQSAELPNGLGSVTFEDARAKDADPNSYLGSVPRFASLQIHHDPSRFWVLVFSLTALGGLLTSLFVARRRIWVKVVDGGQTVELAALARGDDPRLDDAVAAIVAALPSPTTPAET